MAASLSTLVVSWNEAAEMKLDVCNAARVIPCKTWVRGRGHDVAHLHRTHGRVRLRLEFSSRSLRSDTICPGCTDVESPASVTTTLSYSASLTSMNSHLSTI